MTEPAAGNETWIRRFHPAPEAATRLVCFPHAGGSAPFYFPVSATLSPGVEVLTVQYPGRQDRRNEPPIGHIPALADAVFEALRPWLADRPALFGHSMGSVVAFEVARRMEEHSTPPRVLVASGRRAPSRYRGESVHQRDDEGILAELRKLSGTDPRLLADEELQIGHQRGPRGLRVGPIAGEKRGAAQVNLPGDARLLDRPARVVDEDHLRAGVGEADGQPPQVVRERGGHLGERAGRRLGRAVAVDDPGPGPQPLQVPQLRQRELLAAEQDAAQVRQPGQQLRLVPGLGADRQHLLQHPSGQPFTAHYVAAKSGVNGSRNT
ncbi:alpha/beta fold hydrolase [Actinomadura sp. 7K534]|uniref:thioesterase II family protein n=1 Tax=Actinomadura sp. 7K534 TaxID=2530366 RepID=UPI001044E80F|nr:alpha/beta fold hydrolase [Actinomadura sp. 7K534]TDB95509.1 thioesterase [Actinomadura sp. 7K534]